MFSSIFEETHALEDAEQAACLSSDPIDGCKIILSEPGVYALTINPSNDYQAFTEVQQTHAVNSRLKKFYTGFQKKIDLVFEGYDTVNVIEITEPIIGKGKPKDARPRLHSHGLIYFETNEDILYFLLNVAPEMAAWCSYSIKRITDMTLWHKYCHKHQFLGFDILTTGHVIHKNPKAATKSELWFHCSIHYVEGASSPSKDVPEAYGDACIDSSSPAVSQCEAKAVRRKTRRRKS